MRFPPFSIGLYRELLQLFIFPACSVRKIFTRRNFIENKIPNYLNTTVAAECSLKSARLLLLVTMYTLFVVSASFYCCEMESLTILTYTITIRQVNGLTPNTESRLYNRSPLTTELQLKTSLCLLGPYSINVCRGIHGT